MPVAHELYGEVLVGSGKHKRRFRKAQCPHMDGKQCDGGGNRDMARWGAREQPLAPFFDESVGASSGGSIPCGICSVRVDDRAWAICPRRLLTLDANKPSPEQAPLLRRIFHLGSFASGEKVRVWSEVTLRDDSKDVHYRLDYVLRGERGPPVVVEVMTASTSGGNKGKGTDIKAAFCNAVLYAEGNRPDPGGSPGVNIRQVWARMASQLVVKSQIANEWGGIAIWVVQNTLAEYMREKTGLRLDDLRSPNWKAGEVNMISASLENPDDLLLYSGPVRSSDGAACWAELLSAPSVPDIESLEKKLDPSGVIVELTAP